MPVDDRDIPEVEIHTYLPALRLFPAVYAPRRGRETE